MNNDNQINREIILDFICKKFSLNREKIETYNDYYKLPLTGSPYELNYMELTHICILYIEKYGFRLVDKTLKDNAFYSIDNIVNAIKGLNINNVESNIIDN